jgi:hypothetical protein
MHSQTLSCITHTIDAPGPQDPGGTFAALLNLSGNFEVLGLIDWYVRADRAMVPVNGFQCLCRNRKTGRISIMLPDKLGVRGRGKAILAHYDLTHTDNQYVADRISQAVAADDEDWDFWFMRLTFPGAYAFFHLRNPFADHDNRFEDLRCIDDGRLFDGAPVMQRGESNHEALIAQTAAGSIVNLLAECADVGLFWGAEFDRKHSLKIIKKGNPLKGVTL